MVTRPLNTSTTMPAEVVSPVRCGSRVGGSAQSLRNTPPPGGVRSSVSITTLAESSSPGLSVEASASVVLAVVSGAASLSVVEGA